MFIKVDLPDPEGPMKATYSPLSMEIEMSWRALTMLSPILYSLAMFLVSMIFILRGFALILG